MANFESVYLKRFFMYSMEHDTRVKCCIIGDFGVGKTSLVYAWLNRPLEEAKTTLGVDFFSKIMASG